MQTLIIERTFLFFLKKLQKQAHLFSSKIGITRTKSKMELILLNSHIKVKFNFMFPEERNKNGARQFISTRIFFRTRQLSNSSGKLDNNGHRYGNACSLLSTIC